MQVKPLLVKTDFDSEAAALDFFAPGPRHELDAEIARVPERARTAPPLIKEVLHHRYPPPRWGINE